jgi:hypothetical protein
MLPDTTQKRPSNPASKKLSQKIIGQKVILPLQKLDMAKNGGPSIIKVIENSSNYKYNPNSMKQRSMPAFH